jgi:putative ABC transport system permease protein
MSAFLHSLHPLHDLRYGVRLLRRQPGFAALAILLIALGVGTATTLGNLSYVVLHKPLSWPEPDRLVSLVELREGATRGAPNVITNATYLAWKDAQTTIDGLAAYSSRTATVSDAGEPERIRYAAVSASLFTLLKARPMIGSLFEEADEALDRNHIVVISYGLWQRRLGGRPDAIGSTIEFDADPYRVVGVMPRGFVFPNNDIVAWAPFHVTPVLGADPQSRSVSLFRGIARLKPGATPEQAAGEGTARALAAPALGMVGTAVFGTQGPPRIIALPYLESLTADVRPALNLVLAAVVLLLVVAIANIAGMQLARATTRRREIAIRSALGAGPGRIARQLLAENLMLGLVGGAIGWGLSLAIYRLLPRVLPPDFPRTDELVADWRLPVCAIASALAASALFGSLPALLASRLHLVEALTEDSLAPAGGGLRSRLGRTRTMIMAGQVAMAAILLVGASLLGRSFVALLHADRGYEPRNLLTATLPLPDRRFSPQQRAALLDAAIERISHAPGVIAAAAASVMPLVRYDQPLAFTMPAGPGHSTPMQVQANARLVSPNYFAALGIHLSRGRVFSSADTRASLPVVVVNHAFVTKYLTGDPIGVRLPLSFVEPGRDWMEIAGVVDDVRQQNATDLPQPEIFLTYHQLSAGLPFVQVPVILVRTSGDPVDLVPTLRGIVRGEHPSAVLDSVMTMDERLLTSLARPRLYAILVGTFAAFAVIVAGTGLFGILSYTVTQRSREIGIRAALGARPVNIVWMVVRQGTAITMIGLAIGLGAAVELVTFLGKFVYGITTRDPASFVAVPLVLVLVAALACIVPARRAARIDPLKAIRRT